MLEPGDLPLHLALICIATHLLLVHGGGWKQRHSARARDAVDLTIAC